MSALRCRGQRNGSAVAPTAALREALLRLHAPLPIGKAHILTSLRTLLIRASSLTRGESTWTLRGLVRGACLQRGLLRGGDLKALLRKIYAADPLRFTYKTAILLAKTKVAARIRAGAAVRGSGGDTNAKDREGERKEHKYTHKVPTKRGHLTSRMAN